jgi:Ca2+-binding EF-hand superfamily protein
MMDRMRVFDLDKDGAVTQAEVDRYRQEQIVKFDANKDGTLSLDEYQALWLDRMRERMVRGFQEHDRDGNGQVTTEEFNRRFNGLVERFDRNDDGRLSPDDRRNRR